MKLRREVICKSKGFMFKDKITVGKNHYEGVPSGKNVDRILKLDLNTAYIDSKYLNAYPDYLRKLVPEER